MGGAGLRRALPALALAGVLAGCGAAPDAAGGPRTESFHLLCHGWHTGFAVRARDLNRRLPELAGRFPRAGYYEIGWGDAGFYQAREVTAGLTVQAMFHSPGTVVHVAGFTADPARQYPHSEVRCLAVDREAYGRLLGHLAGSFQRGADGCLVSVGRGLYGDSSFYQGVGRYHVCNTCNKWTAKGLRDAGFPMIPALKLTAGSVMRSGALRGAPVRQAAGPPQRAAGASTGAGRTTRTARHAPRS